MSKGGWWIVLRTCCISRISRRQALLLSVWAALGLHMNTRQSLTATIVYDNRPYDPQLTNAWGYSCLIEAGDWSLLFDTGGDAQTLRTNLTRLGIDPRSIGTVMLSHFHTDHTGGLQAVLSDNGYRSTLVVPQSFPYEFKQQAGEHARVVEVSGAIDVGEHALSTGELGKSIIEQSLLLKTSDGLVVITGCAHPGIVNIVAQARQQGEIDLVMGGFHLKDAGAAEIDTVIEQLKQLGVKRVAPSHCTGDLAIRMFAAAFGAGFIAVGAGARIGMWLPGGWQPRLTSMFDCE